MIDSKKILIEVSNRHIHLSKEHIEVLFGKEYQLNIHRELSQPGQFAAKEKVTLINEVKKIEEVRILGPERGKTQVEISKSDAVHLGIEAPIRVSGDLEETPGVIVQGPVGSLRLEKGVILSQRHLHVSEQEALELELEHGQVVCMKIPEKEIILENIAVVVGPYHRLSLHLDRDEGEEFSIERCSFGELIK